MVEYAVILAVSSTSYQSQLTYNRPHAMLPALGKPLVIRLMDRLHRVGIRKYIVVVGQDDGAVASYLNNSWFPDVEMEFVLRMAGESLSATLSDIARQYHKPFLVTSYNSFMHANFPERLLNHYNEAGEALILSGGLTSLSKTGDHYFAVVENQQVVDLVNQQPDIGQPMLLIDTAICGQNVVNYLETLPAVQTPIFANPLMDIFRGYIQSKQPAFIAETAWLLPVINDHDLLALNKHLLDEEQDTHILSELPATVRIVPPVRVDPQVSVGQGATIGPYTYLESSCTVGERAVVHHAMVLQNAIVSAGETVSDVIISSRARIHP